MHKKIMKSCSEKLMKDASKYKKDEKKTNSPVKKKHDMVEKKEADKGAKVMKKLAKKAHEY
jgi:hypothetical protein